MKSAYKPVTWAVSYTAFTSRRTTFFEKKVSPFLYKILSLKYPSCDRTLTNETYADM